MLIKIVIALCVIGVALANQSPVFLWGCQSPEKPALKTVEQSEFAEIIAPSLKDHMIVAFQEENLSSNDFHCSNGKAKSCYAHLQGLSEKTYYANVENPTEALRMLTDNREFNTVGKNGQLENPLTCEAGKVVVVSFDSIHGERGHTLEAHDSAIYAITQELNCPVVYLYMSAPSNSVSKKRVRRASYTAAPEGGNLFREGNKFLLFYTTLSVVGTDGKTNPLTVTKMGVKENNSTDFSVTLETSGGELTFDILLNGGYTYMKQVTYNKAVFRSTDVNAPPINSYYCGNLTLYSATGTSEKLLWNSLQFQAPFNSNFKDDFIFGDSWNCVGFFTPAILAGLFVTIILLAITFTGVCWMMDINTMDRFDDPKGKTITINAGE